MPDYVAQLPKNTFAVLEATTNWSYMYDVLSEGAEKVVMAHPRRVKAIAAARIKTDKIDAAILAGYAALNSDGSVRWVFEAEPGRANGGHADCWRVVRLARRPDDTRLVMTMCGGNALVMTDGAGRLVWRATGHHYGSVDVGEIRDDVPGLELVVDVDHLPQPPKPLCLFDERGRELGRIDFVFADLTSGAIVNR